MVDENEVRSRTSKLDKSLWDDGRGAVVMASLEVGNKNKLLTHTFRNECKY